MSWRHVNNVLGAVLVVLTMWTGFVAAFAHGQARADGVPLVLCSADGPVRIVLDAEGKPTGKTRICPDLAPGLIAALAIAAPVVPEATRAFREARFSSRTVTAPEFSLARPRARAPPFLV
ncbi:MAG: hypothetical protein KDE03_13135 [Rhodobacteraceae bacterium]|nr:hypothetical protein [Paracoccaceae bacterium]